MKTGYEIAEWLQVVPGEKFPVRQQMEYRIPVGLLSDKQFLSIGVPTDCNFLHTDFHHFHLPCSLRIHFLTSWHMPEPQRLHLFERLQVIILAPALHIIHAKVHNHEDDAREQLLHLLARQVLVVDFPEEIHRVGLELAVHIVRESLQFLLYLVQAVAVIIGSRLLPEQIYRCLDEEIPGRLVSEIRAGDEAHIG